METSLECNTIKPFSFLKDLGSGFDHIERLSNSMSYKSKGICSEKSVFVHSLVLVSPVLNYSNLKKVLKIQVFYTYLPFESAFFFLLNIKSKIIN